MLLVSWYFIFYLFSIAERLSFCLSVGGALCLLIGGIALFVSAIEDLDSGKFFAKCALPLGAFLVLVSVLIPDKKDMMLIVAGGAVGEFVSHNEDAKAIPSEVTKWLRAEIKDATNELNPAVQQQKDALMALPQEEVVKRLLAAKDSIK
jgi:hypothetical protein